VQWRLVKWLVSEWAPIWRRHPWVVLIWLPAVAAAVALLVVIFTGGWGTSAFYGWMLLTIVLTSIHESVVRRYERRTERRI